LTDTLNEDKNIT